MATAKEVLQYLRPNGGYAIIGNDYDGITFIEAEPFTKKEFEDTLKNIDAIEAQKAADKQLKREAAIAKLAALGLEPDDLKALGF